MTVEMLLDFELERAVPVNAAMKFRLRSAMLIVGVAMLAGAALRLDHLGERSMTHPEMYVPRIPLREDLSVPKPRMDLWTVVTNTLSGDTHPPVYYVLMWFWTKCFGTSTLAIRLPSVLFGVASIGLVFWLGILIGQRVPASLAAVLLAFNGYHILWSKTARMYSMLGFLGLLTTIFLVLLARSTRPRRALEIGYAALTLLGLSTDYFFWPFFATQIIWVAANASIQRRSMPRLLNVQILVAILGSPLLAFAAYQSDNNIGRPLRNVLLIGREYLQFVYLIPGWDDTPVRNGTAGLFLPGQSPLLHVVLFLLCALLLVMGIRRLKASAEQLLNEPPGRSFRWLWLLSAALAIVTILAHITIAKHHGDVRPTLKITEAMAVLPLFMAIGAISLEKSWGRVRTWGSRLRFHFFFGGAPLVWLLAVTPFAMLAAASVLFRPLIFPRGLLYLLPCLLLTLAVGAVSLGKRNRWVALCLFLILGSLHGLSVAAYRDQIESPVDFKEFADKLKPDIRSADLVFLSRSWATTPILYYLRADQYNLRADHFTDAVRQNPNARVWVLLVRGEEAPEGVTDALKEYRAVKSVQVYLARGILYCRNGCSGGL